MPNLENKRISIKEQHTIILEMAKAFHKVCDNNNIPYYMLGGTMLGAIRHQGFIPWDDDMDFGIPREYFSTFLELCRKELPSHIKVLSSDNSDYTILGFTKLTDTRTIVQERFAPITNERLGVNIDVFPLDHANQNFNLFSKNKMVRMLFKIQKLLFFDPKNRPFIKKVFAKTAQFVCRVNKKTIPYFLNKKLSSIDNIDDYQMYANYFGAWGMKEVVLKSVFGTPTLYKFEDAYLYGVQNAEDYLTQLYGDYNVIPNEAKRTVHSSLAYYVE